MRSFVLFTFFAAAAVHAQTQTPDVSVTLQAEDNDTIAVNASTVCVSAGTEIPLELGWTLTPARASAACGKFVVWATTASACEGYQPDAGVLLTADAGTALVTNPNGTGRISPLTLLPGISSTFCSAPPAIEQEYRICGGVYLLNTFTGSCSTDFIVNQSVPILRVDTIAPPQPKITVTALDSKVTILASNVPSDAQTIHVMYRPTPADGGLGADAGTPVCDQADWVCDAVEGASPYPVEELENGRSYDFSMYVSDNAGNDGVPAAIQSATPIKTFGFFSHYKDAGGAENGGCSVTGGPALGTLAALAALAGLVRRLRS